jgi:hypothetical protein
VCAAQQQSGAQGSKTQASDAPPQASSTQPKAQSANSAFSEATVENVLKRINDGFVSHSAPIVLSAFDRTKMRDYSRFASQLQSTFSQYESFRLHFHVTDFTAEANSGSALVEVEYEATPLSDVSPPVRKGDQLHFEFVRTPQGWKITAMRPWNFFS